jgi:hypothetical protein
MTSPRRTQTPERPSRSHPDTVNSAPATVSTACQIAATGSSRKAPNHPAVPMAGRHRPIRVLVTGSRAWTDAEQIRTALDHWRAQAGEAGRQLVVVHGACGRGADAIADRWCTDLGVTAERWPADWRNGGRGAGYMRNAEMVASAPELCLAFIRGNSPGASQCAALAELTGIPTHRWEAHTMPTVASNEHPSDDRRDDLARGALALAGRGWHVFPLVQGGKEPAVKAWESRATTDPAVISRCWGYGAYNIGVATGPSGLVVIDCDTARGRERPPPPLHLLGVTDGEDVLALVAEHAGQPLPVDTYTVATPSGGRHLYFQAPADVELRNTQGTFGWKVDTRAHGGYVVAAGSIIGGKRYTATESGAPVSLPDWLTEALTPAPLPPQEPVRVELPGAGRHAAYLTAAVQDEVRRVTDAPEHTRNKSLYIAAIALGQLVAGGALGETEVTDVLTQAAHVAGLGVRETARTIASGLTTGAKRPRLLDADQLGTDGRAA